MPMWDTDAAVMAMSNLLTAILTEYDVDEATAASDLDELLEKLSDMGILVMQSKTFDFCYPVQYVRNPIPNIYGSMAFLIYVAPKRP